MDRQNRDRYDYGHDYDRYDGYSSSDEHYHSARNLTDKFERDYQRERGHWNDDRDRYHPERSTYHEGNMGGAYEQIRRARGENRGFNENRWNDRDRYSNYQGNFRGDQEMYNRDRGGYYGNMQQGYGNDDRYGSYRNDSRERGDRDYHFGEGDYDRRSRNSDRNYSGGASYSGRYGSDDDTRYGSGHSYRNEDNWYGTERNRYY